MSGLMNGCLTSTHVSVRSPLTFTAGAIGRAVLSQVGSALTFSQTLFITIQTLPQFLVWQQSSPETWLPRIKARQVPVRRWILQVLVHTTGSLLNNWAFAFHVPLTIQIVFRSAGQSLNRLIFKSCINNFQVWRYPCFLVTFFSRSDTPLRRLCVFSVTICFRFQLCLKTSVFLVSIGVILTTLSRPSGTSNKSPEDLGRYIIGISMLTVSSLLTGVLGMLQERTYKKYGPCWREGVFYTVRSNFYTANFIFNHRYGT
jgi:solute carrier family 35 (UDP-xylose/UDP-N-acetylglucosamine transporter), member B4